VCCHSCPPAGLRLGESDPHAGRRRIPTEWTLRDGDSRRKECSHGLCGGSFLRLMEQAKIGEHRVHRSVLPGMAGEEQQRCQRRQEPASGTRFRACA
jgi:hypothetical protein